LAADYFAHILLSHPELEGHGVAAHHRFYRHLVRVVRQVLGDVTKQLFH
jgi:hypothetical protein